MKSAVVAAVGLLVVVASLWFGCWAHQEVAEEWMKFPIAATASIAALTGVMIVSGAIATAANQ